jgi:hypothetical protein
LDRFDEAVAKLSDAMAELVRIETKIADLNRELITARALVTEADTMVRVLSLLNRELITARALVTEADTMVRDHPDCPPFLAVRKDVHDLP